MTPLQANAPQTVLDLLFPPGEDSSVAVVPDLLPPGVNEDLDRALANIPATLRDGSRPRDHRCGQEPAERRPDRLPGIGVAEAP